MGFFSGELTLQALCDDKMTLYVDGKQMTDFNDGEWNLLTSHSIPDYVDVIAIRGVNTIGDRGCAVSVQDKDGNVLMVTDSSWKCSQTETPGWQTAEFTEGDSWINANSTRRFESVPSMPHLPGKVFFIWSMADGKVVYCRSPSLGLRGKHFGLRGKHYYNSE